MSVGGHHDLNGGTRKLLKLLHLVMEKPNPGDSLLSPALSQTSQEGEKVLDALALLSTQNCQVSRGGFGGNASCLTLNLKEREKIDKEDQKWMRRAPSSVNGTCVKDVDKDSDRSWIRMFC